MEMTKEHYRQLQENYIATRHLMSEADCEKMRVMLNQIRRDFAFKACIEQLNEGLTINVSDFLTVCDELNLEVYESTQKWMLADLIEVGFKGYSCIGKIGKRKENILLKVCNELSTKL